MTGSARDACISHINILISALWLNCSFVYTCRVYQPGFSYSELVKCTMETTAEAIMAR